MPDSENTYKDIVQGTSEAIDTAINTLHSLNLEPLGKVLFRKDRLQKIKELLNSISDIGLVGNRKFDPDAKEWYDQNLRWQFQDINGRNIASEIYLLLARDLADYIRAKFTAPVQLACVGSVIKKYSTFPISATLKFDSKGEKVANSSDIDLFVFRDMSVGKESFRVIYEELSSRMHSLISALPPEIRFRFTQPFEELGKAYDLIERGVDYIEL